MSNRLDALGLRPLFSIEGQTYCWADVLASASARCSLEELRDSTRRGLAGAQARTADPETVREAATRFRYGRGLLSAEELDAWLAHWELSVAEWGEHLERTLLAGHPAGEDVATLDEAALEEAVYVDAVCSRLLEDEAARFAADAALAGPALRRGAEIEAAAAAARAEAASGPGVEREIANHALDWTRLELDALDLDDRGAAYEAALCVRTDGRPIEDVAVDCNVPLERMNVYLEDVEPLLKPSLLAAQPGELIGPVEQDGTFLLLAVRTRTPAAPTDPEVRQRAEGALVDRAEKRALEERVEWHEQL